MGHSIPKGWCDGAKIVNPKHIIRVTDEQKIQPDDLSSNNHEKGCVTDSLNN
jgi:hypothetical protein